MIQQQNPQTSLLRAVGPTLRVNWFARAWGGSTGLRTALWYVFGGLIALIAIAVWAKTMGWTAIPWTIGGGALIAAIVMGTPFALGATPPIWFAGFIRHQAGGDPWLSAEDGVTGGNDYVKGLWGFFKSLLFYTPLVFFGIGFFRIEGNLLGVIPFLGVSLALIIHYAGTQGTFFRNLVVLIYTGIILWILGTWIPPVAERQQQFTHWWTLNVSRNAADQASDEQNADQHAKNVLDADNCFAGLKKMVQPTQEDKDRCEALRKSVGSYVYKNAAEQQRAEANARLRQARVDAAAACWKGITGSSKPEAIAQCEALEKEIDQPPVTATPSAPPPPQGTTGAGGTTPTTTTTSSEGPWNCEKTYRELEFDPRLKAGRVDLEPLPPGRYEITVTGKRQQPFYVMNSVGRAEHAATCLSDPEGNLEGCTDPRGTPIDWKADPAKLAHWPGEGRLPDPSRAHGTVMAHIWGHIIPVGSAVRIGTSEERPIALDLNADRYPLNWSGTGAFAVKIKQCEATRT